MQRHLDNVQRLMIDRANAWEAYHDEKLKSLHDTTRLDYLRSICDEIDYHFLVACNDLHNACIRAVESTKSL